MRDKTDDLKTKYDNLNKSPMFKLSLSSKELFHSNFLEWLYTVDKEAFKRLVNMMAGQCEDTDWGYENWCVKREFNNFDLCIVAYDNSNLDGEEDTLVDDDDIDDNRILRVLFVIENKVKSVPYKEQLIKYAQKVERTNKQKENGNFSPKYILLTLTQIFPDNLNKQNPWIIKWTETKRGKSINKECNWHICSYGEYCDYIVHCYKHCFNEDNPISFLLKDYIGFIECLTALSDIWANDYCDYSQNQSLKFLYYTDNKKPNTNYSLAKSLRIHDLYQKQKFSFLCADLYGKIKDKYKDYTVFPSNQGGLFKERFFTKSGQLDYKSKYICVNYAYLHGEPLLEINIHPASKDKRIELYYAIQVEGDAYERGIQVKKIPDAKYDKTQKGRGKGKDDIAKYVWENVIQCNSEHLNDHQAIINGWMETSAPYNSYNMLDGAYIYQKEGIKDDETIKQVIEKMLCDLERVMHDLHPQP